MSDHGTHHHHEGDHNAEPKSKTSFRSSFWLVVILVGLFIAALNFISAMSADEGHEAAGTEQHGGGHGGHEGAELKGPGHQGATHGQAGQEAAGHDAGHEGHEATEHGADSAAHHE